ncbi:septum site-determining protein MinC [Reinekea marinisedimentorum]|uniref:Probable septum site-determining protein MinC n=1 Tax=Reinekea marinisedimentorum TaxID=230495 RepID=A0A4R3I8R1_9GAMM|nr:septum site-determining protein MinC [Reinekea marinisedimentorum]TCS41689.1 septum site-determining protein MinC [Reinekea marinisedimentorum]
MESNALKLRSRLSPSHQIPVSSANPEEFEQQLISTIQKAPSLFQFAPTILDVSSLAPIPEASDIQAILQICRKNRLVPYALTSTDTGHRNIAHILGLAWVEFKAGNAQKAPAAQQPLITETKVVTTPVRSGQQIYAKDANLLITSQVSAGAEVIADGSIHILGALRGKAIAGAQGATHSEVICQQMSAELIAISGTYLLQEDFPEGSGCARCRLDADHIVIDYL